MKIDLSHFRDTFLQESSEHLEAIESGLLKLKATPADSDLLNSIFRAAHSIKGGAGTFGLTHMVSLTHALENLLDQMRSGQIMANSDLIALMLQANDILKELTAHSDGSCPPAANGIRMALEAASCAPAGNNTVSVAPPPPGNTQSLLEPTQVEYRVTFKPSAEILLSGCNPLLLLRNLSRLGTVLENRLFDDDLPPLSTLDVARSYLAWEIVIRTSSPEGDLREVFEFVEDQAEIKISAIVAASSATSQAASKRTAPARETSSIRVATDKIDKVIDLVGEMVIAQSMTAQLVESYAPESLNLLRECVATLERSLRELHERTMSVRMLPVGTLFGRFERLVHDLAAKTGKEIVLRTSGEETEVDRSVLELLGDPLTHLIRNSADHGLEAAEARLKAGKSAEGTISLKASHSGGNILIEISDDGGGLDLPRIKQKAIEKGLISAEAQLSDDEIRLLIFEPGFSTRSEVTDLSGRGVGMDVVHRNVLALNGTISVDSQMEVGTTVEILLPLTLAIIDGLIIRVASHHFVLPLTSIVETVSLENDQIINIAGKGEVVRIREEAVPFLRLARLFRLSTPPGETDSMTRNLIVVVERGNRKAALLVDELLGQQQVVVKNLEKNFRRIEGALGATILGSGLAALILDVASLIESGSKPDRARREVAKLSLVA